MGLELSRSRFYLLHFHRNLRIYPTSKKPLWHSFLLIKGNPIDH